MWIPTLFTSFGSFVFHFNGMKWLSYDTPSAKWRLLITSTRFTLTSYSPWFSFSTKMMLRP